MSLVLLVVVIEITVLHLAVPTIARDLGTSSTMLLWIVDSYALVTATAVVAAAVLGDRFGHRRALHVGIALFLLGSVLGGIAPTSGWLLVGRVMMGLGGAAIMPASMAVLRDAFPDRTDRRRAVAIWSAVLAVGAALGPLVGGLVVAGAGWRGVFLMNVPILLAVLPWSRALIVEHRSADPAPWDGVAVVQVAVGIVAMVYALKIAATDGGAALVAAPVGVAALVLFARRQLRAERPLVDLRLLAEPTFAVAAATLFVVMLTLTGLLFLLSQYLQSVVGLDPIATGVRLLPLTVAMLVGALFAPRMLGRFGPRRVLVGGLVLGAISLLPLLGLGPEEDVLLLGTALIGLGAVRQVQLVAANDVLLSAVPADRMASASSVEETAYALGGGAGIAVLGTLSHEIYRSTLELPAGLTGEQADQAVQSVSRAAELAADAPDQLAAVLAESSGTAFLLGLDVVVAVGAGLFAVTALGALIAFRVRGGEAPPVVGADETPE